VDTYLAWMIKTDTRLSRSKRFHVRVLHVGWADLAMNDDNPPVRTVSIAYDTVDSIAPGACCHSYNDYTTG